MACVPFRRQYVTNDGIYERYRAVVKKQTLNLDDLVKVVLRGLRLVHKYRIGLAEIWRSITAFVMMYGSPALITFLQTHSLLIGSLFATVMVIAV